MIVEAFINTLFISIVEDLKGFISISADYSVSPVLIQLL